MTSGTISSGQLALLFPNSKNTQRVAALALVAAIASPTRSTSQASLARDYRSLLAELREVPDSEVEHVHRYLSRRNLARKYKFTSGDPMRIEVQDWLLSDSTLPSGTGAEREDTTAAIDLAAALSCVWPARYQRAWVGDLLVHLRPDILDAFRAGDRSRNPYRLSTAQKLVSSWFVLRADRTFLSFLVAQLLATSGKLLFIDLVEAIRRELPAFARSLQRVAETKADKAIAAQFATSAGRLAREAVGRKATKAGVTEQTLRRGFEELLLWRLESLVDLGYLVKDDPLAYEYRHGYSLREIHGLLSGQEDEFPRRYFATARKHLDGVAVSEADDELGRDLLASANGTRANSMGYTLIEEATLLANLDLSRRKVPRVLELEHAVELVKEGSNPRVKVLSSLDKQRRVSAFKMVRADG